MGELDSDARAFIAKVNKSLGPETLILGSDWVVPKRFTSGSLSLDVALGGGFAGNQWYEILGRESSGKTATILKMIAANQALDPAFTTLWVAGEPFDTDQASALGVDVDRLILQPYGQEMEKSFSIMLAAAESRALDLTVLDSYPAMIAEEEDKKAMNEDTVAKGARLFGRFCRKVGKASRRKADGSERPHLGLIVNQWRDKIGGFSPVGTPQTSPGGNAKNYTMWGRIDISRADWIKENRPGFKDPVTDKPAPVVVGQTIRWKLVKHKGSAPMQIAAADFYMRGAPFLGFKRGEYDTTKEIISLSRMFRVVGMRGGGYYTWTDPDTQAVAEWRGKEAFEAAVRSEPELAAKISAAVLEASKNPKILDVLSEADAA